MAEQPIGFELSEALQQQMFGNEAVSYPIDFDDAWAWLEYSRKDVAVAALKRELESQADFLHVATEHDLSGGFSDSSATKPNKYYLSVGGAADA